MATTIGNPGFGALKGAAARFAVAVIAATYFAAVVIFAAAWLLGRSGLLVLVFFLPVIAIEAWFFRRDLAEVKDVYHEARNWLRGGQGELAVHAELARLPETFAIFNDFHPVRQGVRASWNIDHIVVGPTGVFVIDAKNYGHSLVGSAKRDDFTRRNVAQAQRNALELKDEMVRWSNGQLDQVFVVPIVAYAQDGARVESLREGSVRVLPLRLLRSEIRRHSETAIDMDKAYRIARVLYDQMPVNDRVPFETDLRAYGEIARVVTNARAVEGPKTEPTDAPRTPVAKMCPKCGAVLVKRMAKRGEHAGSSFLACPGFPKCRHTEPLPG